MTLLRDTSLQSKYHYARLLITPTSTGSTAAVTPIDSISLLSLMHKALSEWFGPAGGISGVEVQVLMVEPAAARDAEEGAREAVVRMPAATAHLPLTCLPLTPATYDGQSYSLRVLASSDDLGALGGEKGRGREGWRAWRQGLREGSS